MQELNTVFSNWTLLQTIYSYSDISLYLIENDKKKRLMLVYSVPNFGQFSMAKLETAARHLEILKYNSQSSNILKIYDWKIITSPDDAYLRLCIMMEEAKPLDLEEDLFEVSELTLKKMSKDLFSGLKQIHSQGDLYGKASPFSIYKKGMKYVLGPSLENGNDFSAPEGMQSPSSDIYSLALALRTYYTSKLPFSNTNYLKAGEYDKQKSYETRFSGKRIPTLPLKNQTLAYVMEKALEYQYQNRYSDEESLLFDLDRELTPKHPYKEEAEEKISLSLKDLIKEEEAGLAKEEENAEEEKPTKLNSMFDSVVSMVSALDPEETGDSKLNMDSIKEKISSSKITQSLKNPNLSSIKEKTKDSIKNVDLSKVKSALKTGVEYAFTPYEEEKEEQKDSNIQLERKAPSASVKKEEVQPSPAAEKSPVFLEKKIKQKPVQEKTYVKTRRRPRFFSIGRIIKIAVFVAVIYFALNSFQSLSSSIGNTLSSFNLGEISSQISNWISGVKDKIPDFQAPDLSNPEENGEAGGDENYQDPAQETTCPAGTYYDEYSGQCLYYEEQTPDYGQEDTNDFEAEDPASSCYSQGGTWNGSVCEFSGN